ncbi:MAG TPA: RnfH family protein [Burkholderiales bacterium]|nr:RnfH family protein [Burkholderiales bacterium]
MARPDRWMMVEVVYALPDEQVLLAVRAPAGTTLLQAVDLSGIRLRHPEIDLARNAVGIFGKRASPDTLLQCGDRIEIYRPLTADPKETRRRRAAIKKSGRP